mmetsp:Transcript_61211/g.189639  ORF Transcript_61211/g.189639 Transcript_61211/m.189639 type:complete len:241 (-) Transcript_61211:82-804(-)
MGPGRGRDFSEWRLRPPLEVQAYGPALCGASAEFVQRPLEAAGLAVDADDLVALLHGLVQTVVISATLVPQPHGAPLGDPPDAEPRAGERRGCKVHVPDGDALQGHVEAVHDARVPGVRRRPPQLLNELVEIDLAVTVEVGSLHARFDGLLVRRVLQGALPQDLPELGHGDAATPVSVEQAEGRPTRVLLLERAAVEDGGQESLVTDPRLSTTAGHQGILSFAECPLKPSAPAPRPDAQA